MAKPTTLIKRQIGGKNIDNSQYYTRLIVYRGRQFSLAMTVILFTAIFASMILTDLLSAKHWLVIAGPLMLLGIILILIPLTEEWEYRPWQTKTEQIERHFLD